MSCNCHVLPNPQHSLPVVQAFSTLPTLSQLSWFPRDLQDDCLACSAVPRRGFAQRQQPLPLLRPRASATESTIRCTRDAPQFRSEMRAAWAVVDDAFQSLAIFGAKAADTIMRHAARASHHEFPYGVSLTAQLLACSNGHRTRIFPGSSNPLVLPLFNMNNPQTRQSSGFSTGNQVWHAMDEAALAVANKMVAPSLDKALPDIPSTPPSRSHPLKHSDKLHRGSLLPAV